MKKTAAILLLIVAPIFADNLDCAIIVTEDQFGNRLPGYAILTKCKSPIVTFENWLKQNQPGKTIKNFIVEAKEGWIEFTPKH